ncbi:MAG: hypothetical protein ABJA85_07260, partial [Bacteroidota bacterium]
MIKEAFQGEFAHEAENTRKLLLAIPDSALTYKPQPHLWRSTIKSALKFSSMRKKHLLLLIQLFFTSCFTFGQKVYSYVINPSSFSVIETNAVLPEVFRGPEWRFGNINSVKGNVSLYAYYIDNNIVHVWKNGGFFKEVKDLNFGNVTNSGKLFTYKILVGELSISKNGAYFKTIKLSGSDEVYGETDDAGNVYTYTYKNEKLTVRQNGAPYKIIINAGTFGSVNMGPIRGSG